MSQNRYPCTRILILVKLSYNVRICFTGNETEKLRRTFKNTRPIIFPRNLSSHFFSWIWHWHEVKTLGTGIVLGIGRAASRVTRLTGRRATNPHSLTLINGSKFNREEIKLSGLHFPSTASMRGEDDGCSSISRLIETPLEVYHQVGQSEGPFLWRSFSRDGKGVRQKAIH